MLLLIQALITFFIVFPIYCAYCTWCNVLKVRSTGIPYVVVPWYQYSLHWRALCGVAVPLLRKLPPFITSPWLDFLEQNWDWKRKYGVFQDFNSDLFFVVSGQVPILWVADADVAYQMTSRKDDFPKPVKSYRVLNIFGENIVSTTGPQWRAHRKITAPSFNEKNNLLVWQESIEKSRDMLRSWVTPLAPHSQSPTVRTLSDDCMRIALHVIGWAGFRQKFRWPRRVSESEYDEKPSEDEELEKGHKMTFQVAIHLVLVNIYLILGAPRFYLRNSPVASHREAYLAFVEFENYLNELVETRGKEVGDGTTPMGDILSALVRSYHTNVNGKEREPLITEREVLGNCFLVLLAGHETTATTLQISIIMLALRPDLQIKLQDEINRILGDREPDYERDHQALAEGWCGAIMNESLRFLPPANNLPKTTLEPQAITFNNKTYVLPEGVVIHLDTIALHRHPKYWAPSGKSESDFHPSKYMPERWLIANKNLDATDYGEEEGMGPQGRDTETAFYRPYRGSFLAFSDGSRACLGRKFANVEFVAILSTLFREYSVELEVKEGETFEQAKERAWAYVENSAAILTLQPKERNLPVRWVRRGEEKFFPRGG